MRMHQTLPALLIALLSLPAGAANGEREAQASPGGAAATPEAAPGAPAAASKAEKPDATRYAPDNTGRNRQHDTRPEAEDQSNAQADVDLVARVRRALTDDDSLSMQAHNAKIIIAGGRITLRGPVESAAERQQIEAIVRKVAPGRQVVNELEAGAR